MSSAYMNRARGRSLSQPPNDDEVPLISNLIFTQYFNTKQPLFSY